LRKTKRKE
jgi:hypothetical protein